MQKSLTFYKDKVEVHGFTEQEYKAIREFLPEENLFFKRYSPGIVWYEYEESIRFFKAALFILEAIGYTINNHQDRSSDEDF